MRVVAVFALLFSACSPSSDGGGDAGCPSDLPSSCPASPPSYAADIAPLIARRCYPCHDTGGQEAATHNFSQYATVHAQRSSMLNQVYGCLMPPPDAAAPTAEERQKLLQWLVCGAPQN